MLNVANSWNVHSGQSVKPQRPNERVQIKEALEEATQQSQEISLMLIKDQVEETRRQSQLLLELNRLPRPAKRRIGILENQ
jgi:hypothetical protein